MQLGWGSGGFEVWDVLKEKKNPTYTQQKEVLWSKNKHVFISAAFEIQNKGKAFPYVRRGSEIRAQVQISPSIYNGQVVLLASAFQVTQ